ncbi:hypothetical protein D3C76_1366630 [compost metagenome]
MLIENRQARSGQAPHGVSLRTGFFGQQFGGDDAGGITHPFDFDVRVGLFERLLVGLQLFGFEGGVHRQLGFRRKGVQAESGEDSGGQGHRLEHDLFLYLS